MSEKENHILAVYTNKDKELEDAVHFVKIGLDNNEASLLIINEQGTSNNEVQERMHRKYNMTYDEIEKLQSKGDLSIVTSSEWYLSNHLSEASGVGGGGGGNNSIQNKLMVDKEKVRQSWINLVNNAVSRGKIGARVFASTSLFFRLGLAKEFLDYEFLLPVNFGFPIVVICAYQASDLSSYTSSEEIRKLSLHHSYIQIGNKYDVIENPPTNGHIAILYDNEDYRDTLVTNYINEGLKRRQLCVYASIKCRSDAHLRKIKSSIINFDDNIKDENLLVINLSSYYVAAMTNDLSPFDKLKDDILQRTKDRQDKHVRIVADCAPFLYQNKHFDECVELEEWWHQRPVEASVLCPYRKSLIDKFPYDYHRYRVFANHDTILDERAQVIGSFIWSPHSNNNDDDDNTGKLTTHTNVKTSATTAT